MYVTTGITLGVGGRNKRILDVSDILYYKSIRFARRNIRVNIYDVLDRCSWLLDGASTILLISRTQLSHDKSQSYKEGNQVLKKFIYVPLDGGLDTAIDTLLDPVNINSVLYKTPAEEFVEQKIKSKDIVTETIIKTQKYFFYKLVKRNTDLLQILHNY